MTGSFLPRSKSFTKDAVKKRSPASTIPQSFLRGRTGRKKSRPSPAQFSDRRRRAKDAHRIATGRAGGDLQFREARNLTSAFMVSWGRSSISQWPLPFNSMPLTFLATRFICGPRIAAPHLRSIGLARPGTGSYRNFAYSALASFRMGMSESLSFQRTKKSWYADCAMPLSPDIM
jgi:hypothetical protein